MQNIFRVNLKLVHSQQKGLLMRIENGKHVRRRRVGQLGFVNQIIENHEWI